MPPSATYRNCRWDVQINAPCTEVLYNGAEHPDDKYRSILLHWTQVNGTALKCIPKEPDWGPDPLIQVESGYAGYSFVESWTKADDNWWNAGSSNALVMMSASRDFVWHSLIIVPLDNLLQIWQAYSNLSCMVIISKLWTHDVTGCVVTRSD